MASKKARGPATPTPDLVMVAIDSVCEHPENHRRGDVEAIKSSITALGIFYAAIVVQKSSGFILAGNHSHRAAKELGHKSIPACVVDVDDNTARRIMLADNRIADRGDYDPISMLELMGRIRDDGASLAGTGYVDDDIDIVAAVMRARDDGAKIASAAREWSAESITLSAEFFFRAPAELQAKIRTVLAREFPGVTFTESIARG